MLCAVGTKRGAGDKLLRPRVRVLYASRQLWEGARPGRQPLQPEPFEFSLDARVALAGRGLEPVPVQDVNSAARVSNQAHPLEPPRHAINGRPSSAEHDCQELLRQPELFAHAIVGHQQPARTALVDGMQRVARDACIRLETKAWL